MAIVALGIGLATAATTVPRQVTAMVGGTEVPAADYPFVAFGPQWPPQRCDGTLIAENTILTAASCDIGYGYLYQYWGIGPHHLRVSTVTRHPLWNGDPTAGHDLAIVRLSGGPTSGVPTVQVGAPWQPSVYAAGTPATIASHADRLPDEPFPRLFAAQSPLRSDDDMADVFSNWPHPISWNAEHMIGAGVTGNTACAGDEGAPLLVLEADGWTQVGVGSVLSTTGACADSGGYAELSGAQLAWVASQVPSIVSSWGRCTTPTGGRGQSYARYLDTYAPGTSPDGRYWWQISCSILPPLPPVDPPLPPQPPVEEPTPEPTDPTEPPICRIQPWKCPDG